MGLELNKQLSIVSMSTVLQPFINDLNSATELLQVDTRGLLAEVSDTGVALHTTHAFDFANCLVCASASKRANFLAGHCCDLCLFVHNVVIY